MASTPQPEAREPRLADPELTDLSLADWKAIVVRGGKEALADAITDLAAALAYYSFLAIPALLLVTLGLFSVLAGPGTIDTVLGKLDTVVPPEALTLIRDSLERSLQNQSGGVALLALGAVLALWTATGAMNALMRGLNVAYGRKETRNFLRQRLVALAMLGCAVVAVGLVVGLLVLGPVIADAVGRAIGLESAFKWIWWTAQWPILVLGLLAVFAVILYLGPNVEHRRWRFLTPGAVVAVVVWLLASGLFAVYVALAGSYNKAWGSLAAVIILLTWLWLSALALLLGAEINAEVERSRELREGKPARDDLTVPAKA
jgi:membrane protein